MSCPVRPAPEPRGTCDDCGKHYRLADMERFVGGIHVCWDCLEVRNTEQDGKVEWKWEELDPVDLILGDEE